MNIMPESKEIVQKIKDTTGLTSLVTDIVSSKQPSLSAPLLGIVVTGAVWLMTHKDRKQADVYKHKTWIITTMLAIAYSRYGDRYKMDVRSIDSQINSIAQHMARKNEFTREEVAGIYEKIKELETSAVSKISESNDNCDHCGQQHDEYNTDGCPAYCDDDEIKENKRRLLEIKAVGYDGNVYLANLWAQR